jgi:CubicO group peptidase (beta-lactamase class C family)
MLRRSAALVFGVGVGLFLAQPAVAETIQGDLARRIDEYMSRITPFGFSGALLVAKDGKVILDKGYGMAIRAENIPNTAETVFNTGSLTKQFTAAGIMKLEMQGKLQTSDRIGKYLVGVPEDKEEITLHHLLTHTAGVIDTTGPDYEMAGRDETVDKILKAPLAFRPGARFEYSNSGYTLLAAILEIVSGQSYEAFLNEHLFQPAGMVATGYRLPDRSRRTVAHWYVEAQDNGTPLEKPYPSWNVMGNGEILSTTDDLLRWHLALLGDRILSPQAKSKLYKPFLNDYAYGWDFLETPRGILIQHDGGSSLGSSAEMRRYIDAKTLTVVFCNQAYQGSVLFSPIRDKIETLVFGGSVSMPPKVTVTEASALARFEGRYQLPSGDSLTASLTSQGLELVPRGQDAVSLLTSRRDEKAVYQDLNRRSAEIIRAAAQSDFEPLRKAWKEEEEFARMRDAVKTRIEEFRKITGPFSEVEATGTLPLEGEERATTVALKGPQDERAMRIVWAEGKIVGLRSRRSSEPARLLLQPVSETEFAGYDLGRAENVSFVFALDEKGAITGLSAPREGGSVTASRQR